MKNRTNFVCVVLICVIFFAIVYHLRTVDSFSQNQKYEDSKELNNVILLIETELWNACEMYVAGDMTNEIEDYHFSRMQVISKIFLKTANPNFEESFRFLGMLKNGSYHFDEKMYNLYLDVLTEITSVYESLDAEYIQNSIDEDEYWNLLYDEFTSQDFSSAILDLVDEFESY